MELVEFKLSDPIELNGDVIESLSLRRPDGKDICSFGYPYKLDLEDGGMIIAPKACKKYICALAAIPSSAVDKMSPKDFSDLCLTIISFFGGDKPEKKV